MSLLYSWQGQSFSDSVAGQSLTAYNNSGVSTLYKKAPGKIGLGYSVGNRSSILMPIGFNLLYADNTISFWVYVKKADWGNSQTVLVGTWNYSVDDSYKLEILNSKFVWNFYDGISNRETIEIDDVVPEDDAWFHVRIVYSSGVQSLYI